MINEYLNERETAVVVGLIASVKPKVVFEFGVNRGRTARIILDEMPFIKRYVGIDVPWGYTPTLQCQRKEVPVYAGVYAANDPRFMILLSNSSELQPEDLEPADAIFIDGDHSAQGVTADSHLARAILRPGGIIVWHDFQNPAVEVTMALDRLTRDGWPIKHIPDTWLAYMRTVQQ
jgi:predicted O-methyltransferase YrrM